MAIHWMMFLKAKDNQMQLTSSWHGFILRKTNSATSIPQPILHQRRQLAKPVRNHTI